MNKILYLLVLGMSFSSLVFAQNERKVAIAKNHLQQMSDKWSLDKKDLEDISVDKVFVSQHNGVTHVYLRQQYRGVKIFNALTVVNVLPNNEVLLSANRFYPNISDRVNTTVRKINPETAIIQAAKYLQIKAVPDLNQKKSAGRNRFVFQNTKISNSDIHIEPVYQMMPDGKLYLCWQLAIDMVEQADYWNLRVDALSGKILGKNNWTSKCSFGMHRHTAGCAYLEKQQNDQVLTFSSEGAGTDGATYTVFPVPLESPAHGNRAMVNNPADLQASPFGWHDINGVEGAEYTITRGNNVHAYADPENINRSAGDEPDGGETLFFDPSYSPDNEPTGNQDAAVVQLFYMNNVMHDFSFNYGFDEISGNFQADNYSDFGSSGDYVEAEALDDLLGGESDNASFGTPPDGFNGSMSMYVWSRAGGKILQVASPPAVAGNYEAREASFGPGLDEMPVSGEVVIVDDGSGAPTQGCREIENVEAVNGKIAIIDRGSCNFVDKIRNAQAAGAIAAIVCNFEPTLVTMGPPPNDNTSDILIPAVFMRSGECAVIRQFAGEDLMIDLKIPEEDLSGPDQLDGSFDNGIIAHEYGHGISTRLTGGSNNSSCLNNDEQMGEGWSDFFSLVTSVRPGDAGPDKRGIGTFVLRQENDGVGIRRFPYSTDMSVNPLTYKNVLGASLPHGLGEVWTAVLWDLYWALSDRYGWDPDLYHGTGGNNMAIQLVMDGLKIQACNPGFIDGRDAILAADRANYNGANECLIWEVFARRGLGFSADQGDNDDSNDIVEGFDVPPSCSNKIMITKTMTPSINAGDQIEVALRISNYKNERVTGLVVTDELPEGTQVLVPGSGQVQGNTLVYEISELNSGAGATLKYTLSTSSTNMSVRQFLDDGENGDEFWLPINLDDESTNIWDLQDVIASSGEYAWHVTNPSTDSEQTLQLDEEILVSGNQPVLKFNQWHDIDPGTDGGLVEISTDYGTTWEDLDPYFIRNGYTGPVSYFTFASPDKKAFWGDSEGFIPTYVDLKKFIGETIIIRFRFGSVEDPAGSTGAYNGWFIDDVEFLDLVSYQASACVQTDQGDTACAEAAQGGAFVEIGEFTAVEDLEALGLDFQVFPNPAGDFLNIGLSYEKAAEASLGLYSIEGRQLLEREIRIDQHNQVIPLRVKDLPRGMYFVEIRTEDGIANKKVVLR